MKWEELPSSTPIEKAELTYENTGRAPLNDVLGAISISVHYSD